MDRCFSSVRNYGNVSACLIGLSAGAVEPSCLRLPGGVVDACGARRYAVGPPTRNAERLALVRSGCAWSALLSGWKSRCGKWSIATASLR